MDLSRKTRQIDLKLLEDTHKYICLEIQFKKIPKEY